MAPGRYRSHQESVCPVPYALGGGRDPLPGTGPPLEARPVLYRTGTCRYRTGAIRAGVGTAGREPCALPGVGRSDGPWLGALPASAPALCLAAGSGTRSTVG